MKNINSPGDITYHHICTSLQQFYVLFELGKCMRCHTVRLNTKPSLMFILEIIQCFQNILYNILILFNCEFWFQHSCLPKEAHNWCPDSDLENTQEEKEIEDGLKGKWG